MNKLIIIGNGFDLAHGLRTSYGAFIKNYLENAISTALSQGNYDDPLLQIQKTTPLKITPKREDLINIYNTSLVWPPLPNKCLRTSEKSLFFSNIRTKSEANWVDIENEYFNLLISYSTDLVSLQKLNEQFEFLKSRLIMYLDAEQKNRSIGVIADEYLRFFEDDNIEHYYFLNFNYTNTIDLYITKMRERVGNKEKENIHINYIHGSIDRTHGIPIFGLGDEHHSNYKDLKDHINLRELFKNNKSIWYLKRKNYNNLEKFINESIYGYNVEIYGHSCGLSDRTLLKFVLEHTNSNYINIFHHNGESDYSEKTIEISRHFEDANRFRSKVVPYNSQNIMKQIDND